MLICTISFIMVNNTGRSFVWQLPYIYIYVNRRPARDFREFVSWQTKLTNYEPFDSSTIRIKINVIIDPDLVTRIILIPSLTQIPKWRLVFTRKYQTFRFVLFLFNVACVVRHSLESVILLSRHWLLTDRGQTAGRYVIIIKTFLWFVEFYCIFLKRHCVLQWWMSSRI